MYSTVSRLRPASASVSAAATLAAARTCSPSAILATPAAAAAAAAPALLHRSYATGSGKNFTDMFANSIDKFKSMVTRQKRRQEAEKEQAATAAPAAAAPAASDEAVMRKIREEAKLAAVERAKAKARARREAEAAQPPSMTVDEVIRAVLQAEGVVKVAAEEQPPKAVGHVQENRVPLDDLALKGKLVAALVSEARVHLAHADMTRARTVGELRARAMEASGVEPVVKHPVAAWFTQQQEAGKLAANVQFVAYSKKDKLKLKELY